MLPFSGEEKEDMQTRTLSKKQRTSGIRSTLGIILIILITTIMAGFGFYDYLTTSSKMMGKLHYSTNIIVDRLSKSLITPLWNEDPDML